MKKVSIIIPVYNEEKGITACLESLNNQSYFERENPGFSARGGSSFGGQTGDKSRIKRKSNFRRRQSEEVYKTLEVIVIDDGSTDKTLTIISDLKTQISNLLLLHQQHKGPGTARNLGASKSTGEILVFVDADMTFDKNFISNLIKPILNGKAIGTFSKNEKVSNYKNSWSICWNINRNVPSGRMLPENYPDVAPVFRAILKKEFDRVGGFETTGQYTDDWSLYQKLGISSSSAPGAVYYHANPSSLQEVWGQARWIGKNNFISGNFIRIIKSLFIYNPATSIIIGFYKSIKHKNFHFIIFKLVYDLAVFTSIIKSFVFEPKYK